MDKISGDKLCFFLVDDLPKHEVIVLSTMCVLYTLRGSFGFNFGGC